MIAGRRKGFISLPQSVGSRIVLSMACVPLVAGHVHPPALRLVNIGRAHVSRSPAGPHLVCILPPAPCSALCIRKIIWFSCSTLSSEAGVARLLWVTLHMFSCLPLSGLQQGFYDHSSSPVLWNSQCMSQFINDVDELLFHNWKHSSGLIERPRVNLSFLRRIISWIPLQVLSSAISQWYLWYILFGPDLLFNHLYTWNLALFGRRVIIGWYPWALLIICWLQYK